MIILEIYEEQWIPVRGYEGLYECSTEGRIRSLPKLLPKTKNRGSFWTDGKVLSEKNINPDGYKMATLYDAFNKSFTKTMHWFIFYSFNLNCFPKSAHEIDHDDNDKLNNRPNNLKQITSRENSTKRSLQKPKTSKYTGVHWSKEKNKWAAQIKINKKSKHLGRFDKEEDAAAAYQKALSTLIK